MGCYVWYSDEGPGRARAPPSPLIAVPNVIAHPSTASVPTSYYLIWHRTSCVISIHTHRDDLLANHVKHKGEKYRDGMLRGSEVLKDSYHSPVKKIKTIKNLQTASDRQWTIYVLIQRV